MAWTTPLTGVANASLTAAQWNASVRDDLLTAAPALATTAGSHFASTGPNAIAERILQVASVATVGTTTSNTYATALSGAANLTVTATTGPFAVWAIHSRQSTSSAGTNVWSSVAVSGASSIAADDNRAISYDQTGGLYHGLTVMENGLTAGSNTFSLQQRATAGTGTYNSRRIQVIPF